MYNLRGMEPQTSEMRWRQTVLWDMSSLQRECLPSPTSLSLTCGPILELLLLSLTTFYWLVPGLLLFFLSWSLLYADSYFISCS